MMKNILIFSNPFGYGPTGKAISVAIEFKNRFPNYNVVFITKYFSKEIIPDKIEVIAVNERDLVKLKLFLKKYNSKDTFVFSSQNRFPIKAAKSLKIKCAFLDGLSWFWDKIPEDHFVADEVFWLNYPGMVIQKNKLTNLKKKKTHIVSGIVNKYNKMNDTKRGILINIGGGQNPLKKGISKKYLDLLIYLLNNLPEHISRDITISGGSLSLNYIKERCDFSKKIVFKSMPHNEFIEELSKTKNFITTAGQTATMEAFSLNKPVSFILPMFSSQEGLTTYLGNYINDINQLKWSSYIKNLNLKKLNEKEYIYIVEKYSKTILKDAELKNQLFLDFIKLIKKNLNTNRSNKFFLQLGKDGASEIVTLLSNKWKIS